MVGSGLGLKWYSNSRKAKKRPVIAMERSNRVMNHFRGGGEACGGDGEKANPYGLGWVLRKENGGQLATQGSRHRGAESPE